MHYIKLARQTRRDLYTLFESEALNATNEIRQNHGAPPLKMCTRLSKTCRAHAEWLADNNLFEHSEQKDRRYQIGICGENLSEYLVWHEEYQQPEGRKCVFDWYKEMENYKFDGEFEDSAGNFSLRSKCRHVKHKFITAAVIALFKENLLRYMYCIKQNAHFHKVKGDNTLRFC